jgi:hypothetical protein
MVTATNLAALSAALALAQAVVPTPDNANCIRTQLCNGIMCKDVCVPGTVVVDPFVSRALVSEGTDFTPCTRMSFSVPLLKGLSSTSCVSA